MNLTLADQSELQEKRQNLEPDRWDVFIIPRNLLHFLAGVSKSY